MKLTYKQALDLGFKRIKAGKDEVFFNENGFDYFIVELRLNENIAVDWDCETHELKLYRKENFIDKISVEQLNLLIKIFK